jgi:hypothetical protein
VHECHIHVYILIHKHTHTQTHTHTYLHYRIFSLLEKVHLLDRIGHYTLHVRECHVAVVVLACVCVWLCVSMSVSVDECGVCVHVCE